MSRDYRVQYWTAVLGGPPLLLPAALGLAAHRFKTRKNVIR